MSKLAFAVRFSWETAAEPLNKAERRRIAYLLRAARSRRRRNIRRTAPHTYHIQDSQSTLAPIA